MLKASNGEREIDARGADKRLGYVCCGCGTEVVLHQGPIVIHHFKHKSEAACTWAAGETMAHLEAKRLVYDAFSARGMETRLECTVDTMPGDRRADVMVRSSTGHRYAFELQHSKIEVADIHARASAYARAGIRQMWIPFIPEKALKRAKATKTSLIVEGYSPRPYELWLYRFNGNETWMFDPATKAFFRATMRPHTKFAEYTTYFSEGEERSSGGYEYHSESKRDLLLEGPFDISALLVKAKHVEDRRLRMLRLGKVHFPRATVAYFIGQPENPG